MVNPRERLHHYHSQGLSTERGFEQPRKVFERDSHERTTLYTVSGELILKLYVSEPPEVVKLRPGSEFVIEEGVEHSAVVGETGWGYIAAYDPVEAMKYEAAH